MTISVAPTGLVITPPPPTLQYPEMMILQSQIKYILANPNKIRTFANRNMSKIKKDILHVQGIDVGIYTEDYRNEYISLTDIARYRNSDDPRFAIQNWMRNRNTIEFLGLWESLHNPTFNRVQFDTFRSEAGLNRFVMTPSKWIELTFRNCQEVLINTITIKQQNEYKHVANL